MERVAEAALFYFYSLCSRDGDCGWRELLTSASPSLDASPRLRMLRYLRSRQSPGRKSVYFRSAILFALLTVALPAASNAQERPGVLRLLPSDSVTQHEATIGGRRLDYTATAGTLDLFGQDGSQTGAIFYTAYIAKDGAANRPITFAFNGGPGAASAFLHLGLVGPRVLDFGPQARDGANAKLVDNPQSWLDFTDLVLIDPIGTGWSRTAKADDASNYYNVNADAQSMAKAIALYAAHNNRSNSPKYLLGESYGGFRAAKVAAALQQSQGIIVSGAVMLSPLLEGQLMFNADQFALGAALEFPSLVAAEAERRKTFNETTQQDAEKFALGDYLTTLAGPAPTGDAANAFYGKVSAMTGIPADVVSRNRGFLGNTFAKNSARQQSEVMSPYDASFATPDPYPRVGLRSRRRCYPRRIHPRLWRRFRQLRAQRTRLQNRNDLCAARKRRQPAVGMG